MKECCKEWIEFNFCPQCGRRNYKLRFGDFEIKPVTFIGRLAKPNELEVVKWQGSTNYTLALFLKGEESYYLKTIGDRLFDHEGDLSDLKKAVDAGFKYLNEQFPIEEDN